MAEAKTKPTGASVSAYLDAVADDARRADCAVLAALMGELTGEPPAMWGPSIVGFGRYHYTYDSGHSGTACRTGFSSRAREISIYLVASGPAQGELLKKLGKHKMGKACLYVRRLADIDLEVLRSLIQDSLAALRQRHG